MFRHGRTSNSQRSLQQGCLFWRDRENSSAGWRPHHFRKRKRFHVLGNGEQFGPQKNDLGHVGHQTIESTNQSCPRKSWLEQQWYTPILNGIVRLGRQLLWFDEVCGARNWIAKILIWPKVFAFVKRSCVERRKVDLIVANVYSAYFLVTKIC